MDNKINVPKKKNSWSEQKAKIIALYPQVTEDDFYYEIGKKDVMFNALAKKIGKERDELESILSAF